MPWKVPFYPELLDLEPFEYGQVMSETIAKEISGWIAGFPDDHGIISSAVVSAGHGDWLEIGGFYGGTAILAALTKQEYKLEGKVVIVDNFSFQPDTDIRTSAELTMSNAARFGVEDRIEIVEANSQPWPLEASQRFVGTNIDGGHEYHDIYSDWHNSKEVTDGPIIIHDADKGHTPVMQVIREIEKDATAWKLIYLAGHTAVLAKDTI